jgi:hypothetical protein
MQYTIKKPILNQIKKDDKIYKDLDDYIIEDNDDT